MNDGRSGQTRRSLLSTVGIGVGSLSIAGIGSGATTTAESAFDVGDEVMPETALIVRGEPSHSGEYIGPVASGVVGTVVEKGPVDSRGSRWWRVEWATIGGWCDGGDLVPADDGDDGDDGDDEDDGDDGGDDEDESDDGDDDDGDDEDDGDDDKEDEDGDEDEPDDGERTFVTDDRVTTTTTLRIRADPSLEGDQLAVIDPDTVGTILDVAPVDADDYRWWRVEWPDVTGWCVETYLTHHGFAIGQTVEPLGPTNLRANADPTATPTAVLDPGQPCTIDDAGSGPFYEGSWSWWRVRCADGTNGWVPAWSLVAADGPDGTYDVGDRVRLREYTTSPVEPAGDHGNELYSSTPGRIVGREPRRADGETWWEVDWKIGYVGWAPESKLE